MSLVFETGAHPYKQNLVQYPGQDVQNLLAEKVAEKARELQGEQKEFVKEVRI